MGHSTNSTPSRLRQPELEAEFNRSPLLGYEPTAEVGFIRCLEHGYPTPLARWHCHEEYEFHIITATSGKTFVGDWIGPFEPGHVVLCGPRLPHNWISLDVPPEGVEKRDLVIQFRHAPIEKACQLIHGVVRTSTKIPVAMVRLMFSLWARTVDRVAMVRMRTSSTDLWLKSRAVQLVRFLCTHIPQS